MTLTTTSRRTFLERLLLAPAGIHLLGCSSPRPTHSSSDTMTFFVGTYTDGDSDGIYRCRFDRQSGAIETIEATGGLENPSFLALHPTGRYLYAVSETMTFDGVDGGGVFAFGVDASSHALDLLNARPSKGGAPCYVSVTPDGATVLVANYVGGNVAALPVRADGSLGEATSVQQHEGSSVNEERQEAPHAHCIRPDAAGAHALAVDLGIDHVVIYRLEDGRLEPLGSAAVEPGAGPRHIAFHPSGRHAYVINELNSTITRFRYDAGMLEPVDAVGTLPGGFEGENYCADIHVSSDGRFVYGSNRGHDSIVVMHVAEDGSLEPVQHVATGGSWPRNFAIDPSGRFLLAANQRSDNVVVFAIDTASGRLERTSHAADIPSPVCVRFL